ncbi:CDP-alcohol phosphatidyltransferase family protein [Symbioplanes lichenis]|uniref:CDP-alcohol phosphatidyltransferase family protein n=1 Tax=Symbioplanes lichenis TaxID=1629072 RepID=UPI0027398958|nr:CDP-alcohol phosphatidyltransferase family protein [Actinoplanes lichenis]
MTIVVRREVAVRIHPPVPGTLAQAGLLGGLGLQLGFGAAGWITSAVFVTATWVLLSRALGRPEFHRWGPADTVTYGRLILTGGVTALLAESLAGAPHHAVLIALAATSLALDGVDGQVARRTGTTSRFGARFDMESDSVLAVVLSVYLASMIGWWAVAIGLFRYAFVVAAWALPWLRGSLPYRMSRKVVAASQGAVLVVASTGLLPTTVAQALVAVSIVSLIWSFGVDVRHLRRTAAPELVPGYRSA